jgi:hypothetical protein
VEREHRHLDREGERERGEEPRLGLPPDAGRGDDRVEHARRAPGAEVVEGEHAELGVAEVVEDEQPDQHRQAPDHGVDEELDRRVDAARPAPHADHEVHRDERDLPEHVEQEQVQREEGAEHAGLERLHEEHVRLHALVDLGPRGQEDDRQQERGEHDEEQADPVDPEEVPDAVVGQPRRALHELEPAGGRVEAAPDLEREPEAQ